MRPSAFRSLPAHSIRLVAGTLALLVALQAIAVGVISALGPLHTHAAPVRTIVVLDDVRRGPAHAGSAVAAAAARHGHAHGEASRHHHAAGDTSVSFVGEASHDVDMDDAGFGGSLATLVAVLPRAASWLPLATRDAPAPHVPRAATSPPSDPFERPPRSV